MTGKLNKLTVKLDKFYTKVEFAKMTLELKMNTQESLSYPWYEFANALSREDMARLIFLLK